MQRMSRPSPSAHPRRPDALGSSGVQRSAALDRHWRNARTLASHNPRIYKERMIGDFYLNGGDPLSIYTPASADRSSARGIRMTDPKQLILNLFEMDCVSHITHGLWRCPATTATGSTTSTTGSSWPRSSRTAASTRCSSPT